MKERELWLDDIRAIACILVASIHFLESMVKAGLLQYTFFFEAIEKTVYFVPVPIFFFCSGYLYQKGKPVDSLEAYRKNMENKLINLGVPYLFFTTITIILKKVMGDSVNTPADESLWKLFLISPPGQMWFLLILILCFLVFPTMNKKNAWLLITLGLLTKLVALTGITSQVQLVEMEFFSYAIWFIAGMWVYYKGLKPNRKWVIMGLVLLPLMALASVVDRDHLVLQSLQSLFGIILLAGLCAYLKKKYLLLDLLSKHMLPIYLLHTMCAACIRIVLLKLSIHTAFVHIVVGLLGSFLGPIAIAVILEKSVLGNLILYPTKTWKQWKGQKKH